MVKKRAIVISRMDPPREKEAEWNRWYNEEHIPSRLKLPGYLVIRRYELVTGLPDEFKPATKYLTLVEFDSLDALQSKERAEVFRKESLYPKESFETISNSLPRRHMGMYEQIYPDTRDYQVPEQAGYLLAIGHKDLPDEILADYHARYDKEIIPSLMNVPGVMNARRFKMATGKMVGSYETSVFSNPEFITLHDIAGEGVFHSPEYKSWHNASSSQSMWELTRSYRTMDNVYRCIFVGRK